MTEAEVYKWWGEIGCKIYYSFDEFIVCMEAKEMLKVLNPSERSTEGTNETNS